MFPKVRGDSEEEQPITERRNSLSTNIGAASPLEIVSTLFRCDQEIFAGWAGHQGLCDPLIYLKIEKIAERMAQVMQQPGGAIVISGCGTSGRLAFLCVEALNGYLKSQGRPQCFHYLIAGGDRALFRSEELSEDDPVAGTRMLQKVAEGKSTVVFIGISCGLSAPFVAGQLDHCLSSLDNFTPVLIGFNRTDQARNVHVEKWDKTFHQVVQKMEAAESSWQAFILNPVIGPEPVTGSTRMKSGTATRILLDILTVVAVHNYPPTTIPELVALYEQACRSVYAKFNAFGSLIQIAGSSLVSGGHIYYLGCDRAGMIASIDASECVPTFGASFHDVRGFLACGFAELGNIEGDLSVQEPQLRISFHNFVTDILPGLQDNDLVVILDAETHLRLGNTLPAWSCRKAAVSLTCQEGDNRPADSDAFDVIMSVDLDVAPGAHWPNAGRGQGLVSQLLLETSLKWVVNGLSTGAHILRGKVYHNIMVDLRLSNTKLFHRAVAIVQKQCSLSEEESRTCMLRSIYGTDCLTEEQHSSLVSRHIMAASGQEKLVPTAMLMALLGCSVGEARTMLEDEPNISKLIALRHQNVPRSKAAANP